MDVSDSVIWGVDSGLRGCIVSVSNKKVTHVLRMPTVPHPSSKIIKSKVDAIGLYKSLSEFPKPDFVIIELPDPIGNNSRVTLASLFHSIGVIEGVCGAFTERVVTVQPQIWKKSYNLKGKTKRESISVANSIYKELGVKLVKDNDIAEAALVAHWGINYLI